MGNANRCDVCCALYVAPFTPDIRVMVYHHPFGESKVDLCAECYGKLETFLHISTKARNVENGKWVMPR